MALFKKSDSDLADLEAELKDLRKFKRDIEKRGEASSKAKVLLMKLWAGPGLSKSLENWIRVKDTGDTGQTIPATANLVAALIRRLTRVSFILLFLASIPILLVFWQIIVMKQQNQTSNRQIAAQRAAASNHQVTEYLRLLMSSDAKEVSAAKGLFASDLVNRDISIERLGALLTSGNTDVKCSALGALGRIIESSSELTLKEALASGEDDRAFVQDLQCSKTDFSGVDFGPVTFLDSGFPQSIFKSANLSEVEFQSSNLRHSDFSEAYLCKDDNRCVRFLEDTDLSYSQITLTNRNKTVFRDGMILRGAQLKFGHDLIDEAESKNIFGRAKQIKSAAPKVPKISQGNIIASGVCYEASFSQCYLYHKAKDLGQLNDQKLNSLRQNNCPVNLDGPIVLAALTSCKTLGLETRW